MSRQREQVILGTLLGRGFISQPKRRSTFLTITECENVDWLKYKAVIIDPRKRSFIQNGNRFIWKSSCSIEWRDYRRKFYRDNQKHIDLELLNLWDEGLAVWFLDKGCFKRGHACLRTTALGLRGSQIIAEYFNEVGMPCSLWKDRGTGRIVFSKQGTKVLLSTIVQIVPRFMYYKLQVTS